MLKSIAIAEQRLIQSFSSLCILDILFLFLLFLFFPKRLILILICAAVNVFGTLYFFM
jgi:hypothetical protein